MQSTRQEVSAVHARPSVSVPIRTAGLLVAMIFSSFLCTAIVTAQEQNAPRLRISGVMPGGLRTSMTDTWGVLEFTLTNLTETDRLARVVVFYEGYPNVQYARDVWVPANAMISTWMLCGPPPPDPSKTSRNLEFLLYDRTGGNNELLDQRIGGAIRSRPILYSKREPHTLLLADGTEPKVQKFGELPQPESRGQEAVHLVRTFRHAATLSESVRVVEGSFLPPAAEAYEGVDQIVLASPRLAHDPVGAKALRQWLQQGGKLWIMLDMIEPETVAAILGDHLDFQVVDRVGLTSFQVESRSTSNTAPRPIVQRHERPVVFARVLLPSQEGVKYHITGWPLWFTKNVGRGQVVCTMLGARGWYRERKSSDRQSPYELYPKLPVPLTTLKDLANDVRLSLEEIEQNRVRVDSFAGALAEDVGYRVVDGRTVVLVFGGFLLAAVVAAVSLQRLVRREWLGWLGPLAALGAAATLVALGESSRRTVPPMTATAQVVQGIPGTEEAAVQGLVAIYRQDSGPQEFAIRKGGLFHLDTDGLEGQVRRFILTDSDQWHWDALSLPAGMRLASFRCTIPTDEPLMALARFGPQGLTGKLSAGPFRNLGDALLLSPTGRNLAIQVQPDGTFQAGHENALAPGQFLASAVLTDQQQRRQQVYRELLKDPTHFRQDGRPVLMAWSDAADMGLVLSPQEKHVGSALLTIPLRIEPTGPDSPLTIPGALVSYSRRVGDELVPAPTLKSFDKADVVLRFQIPKEVLPLRVERARLAVKINARGRRVILRGMDGTEFVELRQVDSPLDPIEVIIDDPRFLKQDDNGGLHVQISIGEVVHQGNTGVMALEDREPWNIEYVELEVTGRTLPAR